MSDIKVFWLEPTQLVRVELRRYDVRAGFECSRRSPNGHTASALYMDQDARHDWIEESSDGTYRVRNELVSATDPLWPAACDACGESFLSNSPRIVDAERLYQGNGAQFTLRDAPPGAMWDAAWMGRIPQFCGADGIVLCVRTPGGDWMVDGRASNCTLPDDDVHKCWVRHGDPRTGNVHVDKNGVTCAAGAGSIISGNYHGFLHHGFLTNA